MIDTNRKEQLSRSYLNAICAVRGIAISDNSHDDDSIDVVLQKNIKLKNRHQYNVRIGVQLKSTASALSETETSFSYPLKKKNYDDLRTPATTRAFLFLLVLPEEEKEWLNHTVEELVIRKCMYWADLSDLPDCENKNTVSIQIPKANAVSPDLLDELFNQIAEEEL